MPNLYLFTSWLVYSYSFQNRPVPFLGRCSYEATKPGFIFCVLYMLWYILLWMRVCFCCVCFRFSVLSKEIGWEERLRNDLFCVGWDVKPQLNQYRYCVVLVVALLLLVVVVLMLICSSHTRTVVRECCKDDDQSQWEKPKFDPPPHLNPLTDCHQNLPSWLRRGYLPPCKISSRSDKGFRFCACAILRIKLFTRLFVRFFGFFKSSTAKTPARILMQNTSKDAVPRKDVPFGGRKTKI